MRDGAGQGLAALRPLAQHSALSAYAPYHIVEADLLGRLGRGEEARAALSRALDLPLSAPERRLIEDRLRATPSAEG
jgi:RNA polymerase sigma-70 factor (ECF subfamily)